MKNLNLIKNGKIDDKYRKYFFKKELVKIVYLLDELKKINIQKIF
jgi:hypothetical protein